MCLSKSTGLIKLAFAVLPDGEMKHFDATRRWLLDPLASPTRMLASFALATSRSCRLHSQRLMFHYGEESIALCGAHMLGAVGFSQCGFTYAIPLSDQDRHLAPGQIFVPTFDLTLTPAFVHAAWQTIGLASSASESSLEHQIRITYDSIEEDATRNLTGARLTDRHRLLERSRAKRNAPLTNVTCQLIPSLMTRHLSRSRGPMTQIEFDDRMNLIDQALAASECPILCALCSPGSRSAGKSSSNSCQETKTSDHSTVPIYFGVCKTGIRLATPPSRW